MGVWYENCDSIGSRVEMMPLSGVGSAKGNTMMNTIRLVVLALVVGLVPVAAHASPPPAVPEPGEWAAMGILGAGLAGLVLRKRRAK